MARSTPPSRDRSVGVWATLLLLLAAGGLWVWNLYAWPAARQRGEEELALASGRAFRSGPDSAWDRQDFDLLDWAHTDEATLQYYLERCVESAGRRLADLRARGAGDDMLGLCDERLFALETAVEGRDHETARARLTDLLRALTATKTSVERFEDSP